MKYTRCIFSHKHVTVITKGKRQKLSNEEFSLKLRAESHIDEISLIAEINGSKIDEKSHKFAKDGFVYKDANFQDYDGQFYKITISIGKENGEATVYNVGKTKEGIFPSDKLMSVVGTTPRGNTPIVSISQDSEKSNPSGENITRSPSETSYSPSYESPTIGNVSTTTRPGKQSLRERLC